MCNSLTSIEETPGSHWRVGPLGGKVKDVEGKDTVMKKRCHWGCGRMLPGTSFYKKSSVKRGYITHPDELRELCASCYKKYNGSIARARKEFKANTKI